MLRSIATCLVVMACLSVAGAYEALPPRYIVVDLTWKEAATGNSRTERGQLWFRDFPTLNAAGKIEGFGRPGHLEGIRWFVPKDPGTFNLTRVGKTGEGRVFILHDCHGDREVNFAFAGIDVLRTDSGSLDKLLAKKGDELEDQRPAAGQKGATSSKGKPAEKDISGFANDLGLTEDDPAATAVTAVTASEDLGKNSVRGTATVTLNVPVRFATAKDIGTNHIKTEELEKVVFFEASDDLKRETYGGRYLQYTTRAVGDQGRVQVAAATFFGGAAGDERFDYATFLPDHSIVAIGAFDDLGFTTAPITVLGSDPPADAYPVATVQNKGKSVTVRPRKTAVLVHFAPDLKTIKRIVRLPWGSGLPVNLAMSKDGALALSISNGPHLDAFASGLKVVTAPADKATPPKGKTLPGDGLVLRLAPDLGKVTWAVPIPNGAANVCQMPDGRLMMRAGNNLWYASVDGVPEIGAQLEYARGGMWGDPSTGAVYFGGSYRSGTGLEPYVCPYLVKVGPDGKLAWTAYSWSGPIVGTEQFRLVSDSSITNVCPGDDGNISVVGWSDGGNTVLMRQPYDLRKPVPGGEGFCGSTWGATGGLTVRIANLIRIDGKTMEALSATRYISYFPTCDVPCLLNIYGTHYLGTGETAVVGGSWVGYVESHDAWIKSWWIEYQTNEFALAKGGPFFTLFTPDLKNVRMATRIPGAAGIKVTGQGTKLLIYGGATDLGPNDVDRMWARKHPTITKDAVQPKNGGGVDSYLILVDTQGQPNPPVIPERTWGVQPKKDK